MAATLCGLQRYNIARNITDQARKQKETLTSPHHHLRAPHRPSLRADQDWLVAGWFWATVNMWRSGDVEMLRHGEAKLHKLITSERWSWSEGLGSCWINYYCSSTATSYRVNTPHCSSRVLTLIFSSPPGPRLNIGYKPTIWNHWQRLLLKFDQLLC